MKRIALITLLIFGIYASAQTPFLLTRIAFDHVQKGIEPPVSRSAQNIGFFTGYYHYLTQLSPYGIK